MPCWLGQPDDGRLFGARTKTSAPLTIRNSERLAQDLRDERLRLPAFQNRGCGAHPELEPARAARLLRMANSAEFHRVDQNITDLRNRASGHH